MISIISPKEAADLLGCPVALVKKWASQGLIAMGPRGKPYSKLTLVAESVRMLDKHIKDIQRLGKCSPTSKPGLAETKKWSSYLTSGQAANILGVAPRTLSQWFDAGLLTGYRLPSLKGKKRGDRRILTSGLHRFAFEHNIALGPDTPKPSKVIFIGDKIPIEITSGMPPEWTISSWISMSSLKDQLRMGAYAIAIDVSSLGSEEKCLECASAATDVWRDTEIVAILPDDAPDKVPAWATSSSKPPHRNFWRNVTR